MVYIKLLKFRGKTGGFSSTEKDQWQLSIVNTNASSEKQITGYMDDGKYIDQNLAERYAKEWSELLEVPVRRFTRSYKTVHTDKEDL